MILEVITTCPFCGKKNTVSVEQEAYNNWREGALAQNAFPNLTTDERELLISGICKKCWDLTFGENED